MAGWCETIGVRVTWLSMAFGVSHPLFLADHPIPSHFLIIDSHTSEPDHDEVATRDLDIYLD